MPEHRNLSLSALREALVSGDVRPRELLAELDAAFAVADQPAVFIHRLSPEEREPYLARIEAEGPEGLPLYGVPFAIKDNLDLAGIPTTAGCPDYAYTPQASAPVVERLIAAGAIPIGKTNLDQFATGLVGTRSPYGIPRNPGHPERIPGGSSSGSAVAVAEGMASFSLGTDTAGSGRVPAAFNCLVGLKPSRGRLSTNGLVPACRTLDCVSIFATNLADARAVFAVADGYDPEDPFARAFPGTTRRRTGRIAVPQSDQIPFAPGIGYTEAWAESKRSIAARGWIIEEIDFTPFLESARLLYEGPWIAERFAAIEEFLTRQPDSLHPVTRSIIANGARPTAVDSFRAIYRLAELKRAAETVLARYDAVVTPTTVDFPTLAAVEADPIGVNSLLGLFTNFLNLLDLCAVAVPGGDSATGLPFGLTWIAPAGEDERLLALLGTEAAPEPDDSLELVLFGAHMRDLPLNRQVLALGARFLEEVVTAPQYRMVLLEVPAPRRPGVYRVAEGGSALRGEKWSFPREVVGDFLAAIRAPLGLGQLTLADGTCCHGFLCEPVAAREAADISHFGGWRRFIGSEPG